MTIHHTISARGFSAWITTDGEPLPVYQEEMTGAVCSAWIPSRTGQTFSVWWRDDSKTRIATSGHVFIDGYDVASAIARPGRTKAVERAGAKTSARRLRPFCFAALRLTDDETVASHNDLTVENMGTIKIEISRVKLGGEVPFKGYEAQDRRFVHERTKKIGAHCTSYGPSTRTSTFRTVAISTAPYDPDMPGPYVTFIFRYGSEAVLRANGVIIHGERKRHHPATEEKVIEISDSESENEIPNAPAQKRMSEIGSEKASPKQPNTARETASDGPEKTVPSRVVEESQTQVDDYTQIGFGTPSVLLRDSNDAEAG